MDSNKPLSWIEQQPSDFQLDVLFTYGSSNPTKEEMLDVWEKVLREQKDEM